MAFIKGRQIMNATTMANECVEGMQRSNLPEILCKLDIQKTFDHLNWNYRLELLQKMGFGSKWIRWIKH
uniref:Putative ovule protein n=1 Tax=Solanum chacoense TaxID=4108 RepID=A0A0V0HM28_SOLCH